MTSLVPSGAAPTTVPPASTLTHAERVARLAEQITKHAATLSAATYSLLLNIREFDQIGGWGSQGARTCAQWLGWATGLDACAAREHVRVANALPSMPLVAEAFRTGRLSYSKVRALSRVVKPENEAVLVDLARQATAGQLETICRNLKQVEENERADPGDEELRYFRRRWTEGRLAGVSGKMRPEEADLLFRALEAAKVDLYSDASEENVSAETRPPVTTAAASRRRAAADRPERFLDLDALLHIADAYLASRGKERSGGERTMVVVHVDRESLSSTPRHSAEEREQPERSDDARACEPPATPAPAPPALEDGTPIPRATAQRLACDASLVEVVHGPGGEMLSVGRRSRTIPAAILRAVIIRDKNRCQFPGCGCKAFLEGHHIDAWADGGPTSVANILLLCGFHHAARHEGVFSIRIAADGKREFIDAYGRRIEPAPAPPPVSVDPMTDLTSALDEDDVEIGPYVATAEGDGRVDHALTIDLILGQERAYLRNQASSATATAKDAGAGEQPASGVSAETRARSRVQIGETDAFREWDAGSFSAWN